MPARSVLIFAKPPVMGLSKTRLARDLGVTEAQRIARRLMGHTLREVMGGPWQTCLYTTPQRWLRQSLGGLWPHHLHRRDQGTGGLTDRLEKGLRETPSGSVLFIGSDAPGLKRSHIASAFAQLRRHDAVFGPADDGGFWLFGLNKTSRTGSPFGAVRWSTEYAMADVATNLPEGTRLAYQPPLTDVDTGADWASWRASNQGNSTT